MAQNEPPRKETPPGPSPYSPSLLFEYQCRSGKFITLANRIEKIDLVARIESNRNFFCPNWNALLSTLSPYISVHRKIEQIRIRQVCVDPCPSDRSVRRWLLLLSGAGICQLIARKRRGTDGHQPDA